jgi:hypothetical protein
MGSDAPGHRPLAEAQRIALYLDMVEDAPLPTTAALLCWRFARLRGRLAELGAERRQRGRVRYWILKPDFIPGEVIEL